MSGGFDNGTRCYRHSLTEIELPAYNNIYSFRVTAVNDGGESFPSETLSVGLRPGIGWHGA
ncbi:MAG: fibronectin type III domain-containing protein [Marinilabiliales bacterium]|nr:fibronectin type III domain-containing protein [Marinilabiliales bacterium]